LRVVLQTMADPVAGAAKVVDVDLAFHRALLDAAHNELLSRMEVVIETGLRARDLIVHVAAPMPEPAPLSSATRPANRFASIALPPRSARVWVGPNDHRLANRYQLNMEILLTG
jgi:hypothetical protein